MKLHFSQHRTYTLTDLVDIERARNGVIYPAGCIIIQLSASHGQCFFLDLPQTVEAKYCVLTKKPHVYLNMYYLYSILLLALPSFLEIYQTGLNIQPEVFNHMEIELHTKMHTQDYIADLCRTLEQLMSLEERFRLLMTEFKNWVMSFVFVNDGDGWDAIDSEVDPHVRELAEETEMLAINNRRDKIFQVFDAIGLSVEGLPYPVISHLYFQIVRSIELQASGEA